MQDLRFALRQLARSPGYALVVVLHRDRVVNTQMTVALHFHKP